MSANQRNAQGSFGAAALYYTISGLLLPVSLLGYIIWIGKTFLSGRSSGVSLTAQGPLWVRWFQHNLGVRHDEVSDRLMAVLPGVSPLVLRLVGGPALLARRVSAFVPKAFRYPFDGEIRPQYEVSARVAFFDDAVDRYLTATDQLVILGAGYDTRALRLRAGAAVRCFEVDLPRTQAVKREALKRAGIEATTIRFVAADFEKQDWLAQLLRSGFDPARPALFIWEGVIMYLDEDAVESTLRRIAGLAKGTAVAFDYFTTEALESKAVYWRYARATTRYVGEPLKFGIDATPPSEERLAEFLRTRGLSLVGHELLGQETSERRAWGGFAVATVV